MSMVSQIRLEIIDTEGCNTETVAAGAALILASPGTSRSCCTQSLSVWLMPVCGVYTVYNSRATELTTNQATHIDET